MKNLHDRIEAAIDLIVQYGWIDDAHHKNWVLDQVVRILAQEKYKQVVKDACATGADWDVGIPP